MSERPAPPLLVGRLVRRAAAWLPLVLASCGYRPAAEVMSPGTLCVRSETARVADPRAAAALESGARQALARAGRLGECGRDRQLLLELVGLDDIPEGVVSSAGSPDARGERVVASAHGVLIPPGAQERELDLGVVRVGVTYGYAGSSSSELEVRSAARWEAAWRAGKGMAERAMGDPGPSDPRPNLLDSP